MYIFCSKALSDSLNIKKNELHKVSADAQIDDLYAWHGHVTKLNGKNTIILMNDRTMYSLIFRNKLPKNYSNIVLKLYCCSIVNNYFNFDQKL